jgi:hypothetical protein
VHRLQQLRKMQLLQEWQNMWRLQTNEEDAGRKRVHVT